MNPRLVLCYGDHRMPYFTAYTMDAISEITAMIDDMDEGDPHRDGLEAYFYGQSDTLCIDDSGRLILTAALRDRVGITDLATFAARGKTFRIHSPEAPEDATSRLNKVLAELPEGVAITSLLPKKRRGPE
ncbi:division/cell wall cluster transcriptional repressor MraZ [Jannaschia donghaensis]|uniref:division/cell wall cluster transcriptional repressor MraZ n=1 Tax=Jannaschia donghaensis TaxID=420998 RepID=UPI001FE0A1A7|nr:division/cell wall cluster transcriptional repressor MraZ [Jannaschia donghaensis]